MIAAWGPADWYFVAGAVVSLLFLLVGIVVWMTDNAPTWQELRHPYPKADPLDTVPYQRPEDKDLHSPLDTA